MQKILFVDDNESLLQLYREESEEEGYEVIVANDGKEALSKFMKEEPDLVVMDIRMPVMKGIQAMARILRKNRHIPVILNTAFPQYRENFLTWGADAYVLKSSDLTELKQKIREVLDRPKRASRS